MATNKEPFSLCHPKKQKPKTHPVFLTPNHPRTLPSPHRFPQPFFYLECQEHKAVKASSKTSCSSGSSTAWMSRNSWMFCLPPLRHVSVCCLFRGMLEKAIAKLAAFFGTSAKPQKRSETSARRACSSLRSVRGGRRSLRSLPLIVGSTCHHPR